jgi:hypothetical protein
MITALLVTAVLGLPQTSHTSDLVREKLNGKVKSTRITRSDYMCNTATMSPSYPLEEVFYKENGDRDSAKFYRTGGMLDANVYSSHGMLVNGEFLDTTRSWWLTKVEPNGPGEGIVDMVESISYEHRNYGPDGRLFFSIDSVGLRNERMQRSTYFCYDENGRLVTKTEVVESDWKPKTSVYTYLTDRIVERVYFKSAAESYVLVYYTNNKGQVTTLRKQTPAGALIEKRTYVFDSKGSVTQELVYAADKLEMKTVWAYKYAADLNWIERKETRFYYGPNAAVVEWPAHLDKRTIELYP